MVVTVAFDRLMTCKTGLSRWDMRQEGNLRQDGDVVAGVDEWEGYQVVLEEWVLEGGILGPHVELHPRSLLVPAHSQCPVTPNLRRLH